MKHIHTRVISPTSAGLPRAASVGINQTLTRPYKKRDEAAALINRDLQRHAERLYDALAMVSTAFENTPIKQLTSDQRAALYHASLVLNPTNKERDD